MRMSIEEYKQQVREVQKNLRDDAILEWSTNHTWINSTEAVPNFRVTRPFNFSGFVATSRVSITVQEFNSVDDIEVTVSGHNIYRGNEKPKADTLLDHVEFYLRVDYRDYLVFCKGYLVGVPMAFRL